MQSQASLDAELEEAEAEAGIERDESDNDVDEVGAEDRCERRGRRRGVIAPATCSTERAGIP